MSNIFTSEYHFSKDEELLAFQYNILKTMLVFLVVFSLLSALLHTFGSKPEDAISYYTRYVQAFVGFTFLFILKKYKNSFNLLSYSIVAIELVFFSYTLVHENFDTFRMVWFLVLTIAAFIVHSTRLGVITAVASAVIIIALNNAYHLEILRDTRITIVLSLIVIAVILYSTTKKINQIQADLASKNHILENLASYDALTGIMNRRMFLEIAEKYFKQAKRDRREFYFIMLDLDHFKRINDNYGHKAGDDVLVAYAGLIKTLLRENDIFGRLGGEEFGIALLDIDEGQALLVAEKVRQAVEAHMHEVNGRRLPVTVSVGVSSNSEKCSLEEVMHLSDLAMYEAKSSGRNKVCFKESRE